MSARVIGQPAAVDRLRKAVVVARAGLRDGTRPRGVFMFTGPSGVGKTELAKALADGLFPGQDALLRVDMAEFSSPGALSRLIGAPPGYVGHNQPGQLTAQLRRRPYSIVLLDEFEKAHADVQTLFLSLFDEGYVKDAKGRKVSARETYFILTSNVGSEAAKKTSLGFGAKSGSLQLQYVRDRFRPELLNRIDAMVAFSVLSPEALLQIAGIKLSTLKEQLCARGFELIWSPDVLELCATHKADAAFGARPIVRAIDSLVKGPLSELLAERPQAGKIHLGIKSDGSVGVWYG